MDDRARNVGSPLAAVLILALVPAIGLGIARFAYALILPDMRASLGWTFAESGFMNTANAAGYLLGALAFPWVANRLSRKSILLWGTLACIGGLIVSAESTEFSLLTAARTVAGVGSALAFVAGGVLATEIAQTQRGREAFFLGLYYAGPGVGIVLSGLVSPYVFVMGGAGSWPTAWGILSLIALILLVPLPMLDVTCSSATTREFSKAPLRAIAPLLIGYGMFGAGYIAYMTFMIAYVQKTGAGAGMQALFWATLGIATIASPWLWSRAITHLKGGRAVAVLATITMVGAVLPLLIGGNAVLFLSALLFGSAFFSVVTAGSAFVRSNLPQPEWRNAIATLTIAFGIGQTFGPFMAGVATDLTNGELSAGLWSSVILLAAAVIISLLQRDLTQQ